MRHYDINNKKVPSVTTILSILGSQELLKWANSLGFRHIDYTNELNRTAVNGTKMHSWIQRIVDPDSVTDELIFKDSLEEERYKMLTKNFNSMISLYDYRTIFTEKTFISEKLGYGGTVDWVAFINNFKLVLDFKSSKRVQLKQLLQLGAYYNLMSEVGETFDGAAIILVNERMSTLYPINLSTLQYLGNAFNVLAGYYNLMEGYDYSYDKDLLKDLKKIQ